jgi:hypothetical protein
LQDRGGAGGQRQGQGCDERQREPPQGCAHETSSRSGTGRSVVRWSNRVNWGGPENDRGRPEDRPRSAHL